MTFSEQVSEANKRHKTENRRAWARQASSDAWLKLILNSWDIFIAECRKGADTNAARAAGREMAEAAKGARKHLEG